MEEDTDTSGHHSTQNTNDVELSPLDPLSFSFPTLHVNESVASLAVSSQATMRPAPPSRTPSETTSHLEDSTYDLISNADLSGSGILSDSDARTESLASFDGNTPDDVSVINSGEDSDDERGDALNTPLDSILLGSTQMQQSSAYMDEPAVNVTPTIGDSGYTSRTVRPESSFREIDLYIDEATGSNEAMLFGPIQSVDEPSRDADLSVYKSPYVGVTMKMAVSWSALRPRGTFRVLIMSYHTQFNEAIAEHLGDVLRTAVPRERSDEQTSLYVQHCAKVGHGSGPREILFFLDRPGSSAISVRAGNTYSGNKPYPRWDLAIFLHTSLANIPSYDIHQLETTFELSRMAMKSLNVPIMDLSTHHPLYKAVPHMYTCDKKSLHLRVVTKKSKDASEVLTEVLPVDLDKFFAIDPVYMGKHLECITQQDSAASRTSLKRKRSVVLDSARNAYVSAKKFTQPVATKAREHLRIIEGFAWVDIVVGLLVGLAAIVFCSFVPNYLSSAQNKLEARISPAPTATPSFQAVENWANMIRSKESVFSENTLQDTVPTFRSTPTKEAQQAKAKKLKDASNAKAKEFSKRDEEIEKEHEQLMQAYKQWTWTRASSRTFTLTPSHQVSKMTNKDLQISIVAKGKKRESRTMSMANGAWTVEITDDFAETEAVVVVHGSYQLQHMGKVPFTYDFTVSPIPEDVKTTFEAVRDLVAQEFILVQNNAMELSTRMTTGLQHYIDDLQQQTLALHKQALKRVDDTRKALLKMSTPSSERRTTRQKLRQLKKTKKALQKQSNELKDQLKVALRLAKQQYRDLIEAVPQWHRDTAWPVRADDWTPTTALRRGLGNAHGLLKKMGRVPRAINGDAVEKKEQDKVRGKKGGCAKRKAGCKACKACKA